MLFKYNIRNMFHHSTVKLAHLKTSYTQRSQLQEGVTAPVTVDECTRIISKLKISLLKVNLLTKLFINPISLSDTSKDKAAMTVAVCLLNLSYAILLMVFLICITCFHKVIEFVNENRISWIRDRGIYTGKK